MTLLSALPIIGILFLIYSLIGLCFSIYGSSFRRSLYWPAVISRSAIFEISRSNSLVVSFAAGLTLVYLVSAHAAAWVSFLWAAGVLGFLLLLYVEYRRQGYLSLLLLSSLIGFPLAIFFNFLGPASALNFHDDLAKYLILPIGLVENRGLDFGPLGPQMGSASTLTAGLQALYLIGIDLEWIAHWDISISLAFIIVIVAVGYGNFSRSLGRQFTAAISLVASIFFVNIMYVNISAVYLPATIFAATAGLLVASRHRSIWEAIGLGCLAATFYLFKFNYILLSAALMIGYFLFVTLNKRLRLGNKLVLLTASLGSFSILAPDAVSKIIEALISTLSGVMTFTESGGGARLSAGSEGRDLQPLEPINTMFSLEPTFYGYGVDSYFSINIFIALIFLVSLLGLLFTTIVKIAAGRCSLRGLLAPSLIGIQSFLILSAQYYLFSNNIGAVDANIRYMMPAVLALVLLSIFTWVVSTEEYRTSILGVLMCVVLAFIGSQVSSSGNRFFQAVKYGNILAFPAAREELVKAHTDFIVGRKGVGFVNELQSLTPEGSAILAVTGFPSLFDFQRNKILLAEANGDLSKFSDSEFFLDEYSVDFILWQTRGLGVRTVEQWEAWGRSSLSRASFARKNILFLEELARLANRCKSFKPVEQVVIVYVAGCDG